MFSEEREAASDQEALHPSSGLTSAGYRSAKYTPAEWHSQNDAILRQAIHGSNEAQIIQQQSETLSKDTEAWTLRTQAGGTCHLGDRLQDIHFWKSDLQVHIEKLGEETDLLLPQKLRLENALDDTEIPYAIATDNLICRERRLGPDLVKDSVENELLKEVDLIRCIQALLKRTISQAVNQIKINRDTKTTLELDWSDKYQAYDLDDQCGHYSNMSIDTELHPSSATMQDQRCISKACRFIKDPNRGLFQLMPSGKRVSNCDSWMKFTQTNLNVASRALQASMDLRGLADRVLQEIAKDLKEQCITVDQAFNQRCLEMTEARIQLDLHLAQILEQIGCQERNIVSLQQAIHDKEAPMRVAQSRLYLRSLRPNMELCRDGPQFSLVVEVGQIETTLASLRQRLNEARGSLSRLEESRMVLEKDITCKTHSLLIDRDKCMAHRRHYPTQERIR